MFWSQWNTCNSLKLTLVFHLIAGDELHDDGERWKEVIITDLEGWPEITTDTCYMYICFLIRTSTWNLGSVYSVVTAKLLHGSEISCTDFKLFINTLFSILHYIHWTLLAELVSRDFKITFKTEWGKTVAKFKIMLW